MAGRLKRKGFSLLEIIAAVIILAVVAAATVATVAPMRQKANDKMVIQELATLNSLANTYFIEYGTFPSSITSLRTTGYLAYTTTEDKARYSRLNSRYKYDRATGTFSEK